MKEESKQEHLKKDFHELYNEINENFNWEKVYKAMVATDWIWKLGEDENGFPNMGTPSIHTIKNHAKSILKKAYDLGKGSMGSGGFMAGWEDDELYLVFILEEWSAY